MTLPSIRPEDRHGRAHDGAAWADTVPLCFRSEAFPEDLPCADVAPGAALGRASGRALGAAQWLRGLRPPSPPPR